MASTQAKPRSVGPKHVLKALGRKSFSTRAVLAEFIGMTFFVFTGCGELQRVHRSSQAARIPFWPVLQPTAWPCVPTSHP